MNIAQNTQNAAPPAPPAPSGLTLLVEETVESRLRNGRLFTTLDISNDIKRKRFHVRHGQVAQIVRELYQIGAMQAMNYERVLIEVNTDNGEKTTEAFLYLPKTAHPADYAGRVQDALPPLDGAAALDPTNYVPLHYPTLRALASGKKGRTRGAGSGARSKFRRDGALPIPRPLIQQAGWNIGDLLVLIADGDILRLVPAGSDAEAEGKPVKVWADYRVRIAKTKLNDGADITLAHIKLENGAVEVAWKDDVADD